MNCKNVQVEFSLSTTTDMKYPSNCIRKWLIDSKWKRLRSENSIAVSDATSNLPPQI